MKPQRQITAADVARAIVMACRAMDEDPEAVVSDPTLMSRGRRVAYDALRSAFPDEPRTALARYLGFPEAYNVSSGVNMARRSSWWPELLVDEIVGCLVAGEYGDRAA